MSRSCRRVVTGAALSVSLLLGFAGGAWAGDDDGGPTLVTTGATGEHSQGFGASQSSAHQSASSGSSGSSGSSASSASTTSYDSSSGATSSAPAYPPAGPYGTWTDAFPKNPNADLSWMPGAVDACGSTWGGDGWNAQYAVATPCAPGTPAAEQPPGPPQITTAMVVAAASAVAPTNPPHVQPGQISYVHVPNNYWAEAPTVNASLTLLGVVVPLRWTPISTTWSFGDGSSATGNGIAGADAGVAGTVEHAYDRQGSYAVTTATAYDLTFTIPGQGAQTVQLSSPPSPAVTLPIREIQTRVDYVS